MTVIIKSKQAAAIRAALAGLVRTSASDCMETVIYFKVMFLAYPSGRPTYMATELACPTPGVVNISVDGKTTQHFKEDCALQHAVVSALPKGRAEERGGTSLVADSEPDPSPAYGATWLASTGRGRLG